jgi:DNA repair protein RecN (Recombination protein N)
MLRFLSVRDFAIVEQIELELQAGLTVLTGETGAGKSILVDALELLSGGRAGADVVRAGAERADITATADVSRQGAAIGHVLAEHAIPCDGELILRRVVGSDGRSRAWLNGQSVPLQVLRAAAELLFEIHGQHEFQSLVRSEVQRGLLDAFGQHEALADKVSAAYSVWLALLNRSIELESAADERLSRLDLLRHQLHELEALAFRPEQLTELKQERTRLAHRGRLIEAVRTALTCLYEAEGVTAQALLARADTALRSAAALDQSLQGLVPLLEEASIRVTDVGRTLVQYLTDLEVDPERAETIERRLAAIEELARKHRTTSEALPARQQALAAELAQLENAASDLATVRAQLTEALAHYHDLARQLTARRTTAARSLARQISGRMQELGMSGGRFLIDVSASERSEPAAHGLDRVEFRVSTNPGQPLRALAKVASGGELARLSLAVQVCCAAEATSCMVFDEVDAGIGGAVAEIVGRELRALSARAQILCVTHLPQVAAQGQQHLRVIKSTEGRHTRVSVTALSGEARVEELARMLGGVEITSRARAHALEMLNQAVTEP